VGEGWVRTDEDFDHHFDHPSIDHTPSYNDHMMPYMRHQCHLGLSNDPGVRMPYGQFPVVNDGHQGHPSSRSNPRKETYAAIFLEVT
jgi:hypothetical protein